MVAVDGSYLLRSHSNRLQSLKIISDRPRSLNRIWQFFLKSSDPRSLKIAMNGDLRPGIGLGRFFS